MQEFSHPVRFKVTKIVDILDNSHNIQVIFIDYIM